MDRYFSPNLGVTCIHVLTYSEKMGFMEDGCLREDSTLLCYAVAQSRAKNAALSVCLKSLLRYTYI